MKWGRSRRRARRCWRWSAPTSSSRWIRRTCPRRTSRDDDPYSDCKPVKDSKFIPEAWTRIGEFHFDSPNELRLAIAAFKRVLEFKDSPYYDRALYKLAWSYYRDNRFPEAVREFDNLVMYADKRKAAGQKVGSDLRPEAIQYLGVSFSEPDWDGDTVPDAETGLQRATAFYKGREDEPHVREVFQRLGDIYFDSTKYAEAIAVYKTLLSKWPDYTDAPRVQDKIVRSYERDRNLIAAAKEREALGRNYTKGSAWYEKNKDNPEALAVAQQLAEDALLTAATNVHAGAQACKTKWQENQKDLKKLEECKALYRTAAELYEKYLAAYPNSKRSYEFSAFYADALYYSGQLPQAIVAYQTVRDSQLDNRYQEDSAFRMIKAYEEIIDDMRRDKKIDDPPIPDEKNTKPPVTAIAMPDIYLKYTAAIDWYVDYIKNERTPDLKYAAAVIALRYHNWPEARRRLGEITQLYCGPNPEIGFKAYDAILQTYFIDYSVQDEEQKDCALGKLLNVADQFSESPCGKSPKAAPYLERIAQIKASVKTTIITKRLQLSMENEEKGTNKELTVCRESSGGIAMVTGSQHRRRTRRQAGREAEQDLDRARRRAGAGSDRRRQRQPQGLGRADRAQQRLRHLRKAVPVRRGDQVLRAPLQGLPGVGVGQGSALELVAQPLPLLRVRSGGQGLPDGGAGSQVRRLGAPQGGAGPGGVAARQRSAVSEGGRSLQALLGGGVRQAAGQRAGLLLRLQRLRKGQGHRQADDLPQGLHQEVQQHQRGRRPDRAGVHEAGGDHRAVEPRQERRAELRTRRCATSSSLTGCRRRRRRPASRPRPTS